MAAKKAAEKKVKELWVFTEKGDDECFYTYTSRDKAIEGIKKEIADRYDSYDTVRTKVYQLFKLESEIKFEVEIKEVPSTVLKTVVKEKK